jgi:dTDP-4-amino-4,6-dideoxygalactose transaminase
MRNEFLVFGSPLIGEAEIEEVISCLQSGWIGTGPKVNCFENDFRNYIGAHNATAVNSCTAALHLSILAAGIKPGDEVITTAMTFCATVNAIIHTGAKPVLVDCNPETFCLDVTQIEDKITSRTKAIIPVHFAGSACKMDKIVTIAEKYRLKVIEDCAHSIETTYQGKHVGTFGDFGCFSFYVTKNVITGEGGMVVSRNKSDADRIKVLALHGMSADAWKRFSDEGYKHYQVVQPGFKYNMMDLQAAIGIHQLKKVDLNRRRREEIWDQYNEAFSDLDIKLPAPPSKDVKHAYHLYSILIDCNKTGITRDEFLCEMQKNNIGVGVHYRSIPTHPYYQDAFGWSPQDYPNSYYIGECTVSLPISAKLSEEDVSDVINAVKEVLGQTK